MKNEIVLAFVTAFSIGMVFTLIILVINQVPATTISIETKSPTIQSHKEIDYLFNQSLLSEIETIAYLNTLGKTYELDEYDCTQFSEDLVKKLKAEGFKAQCTAGYNYEFDYPAHTWVSVWIDDYRIEVEATGGYILNDNDYKNYKVYWEDRCW